LNDVSVTLIAMFRLAHVEIAAKGGPGRSEGRGKRQTASSLIEIWISFYRIEKSTMTVTSTSTGAPARRPGSNCH
jgi:hypothetical protein